MFKQYIARCSTLLAATAAVLLSIPAHAVNLNLSPTPLFLSPAVPPLNMLVVGRDHKLYYEAYNDYSDLNDDGELDLKYKPATITYYGYFDSQKCYVHDGSQFNPTRLVSNTITKTCGGTNEWSGDFLNYLTTARIDALRKVLYGGFRSTDEAGTTVLERTFLPQDAHSWGKEYTSVLVDGYNIRQYTPYALPTGSNRHFFANTTLLNTAAINPPLLRVLRNRPSTERIWNWVSIERPVAGGRMFHGGTGPAISPAPTDLVVRVAVCVAGLRETNCQRYGASSYKPIGLLQEFGENNSMYFGLITGSYLNNISGGVLRRRMDSIATEINTDGTFKTAAADAGIIASLNRLRVTGFGSGHVYTCGFTAAARLITEGECQMWGNPIAEMMYESLRYFAGVGSATSDFAVAFGAGEESQLTGGGLPVATWDNPYSDPSVHPSCAKPFQTVVSDINPSYDTDQLPGTAFGSFTSNDLPGLDVSALGQTIWNEEFDNAAKNVFIGDVGGVTDGAPTSKLASSFGNIRGLSPEEPTKQGGYYAASVAYHGLVNDINPTADGDQKVKTFAVALASPLPKIVIPVGTRNVTLVPFAKSVAGSSISSTGNFQPTDQIVDFYVESRTANSGRFRVNFEDVEQGADHDMDAIAIYDYSVIGSTVRVTVTSEYAAGGITQHMGYVISGTTRDGIYLEVLDQRDGDVANDTDYRLDTPNAFTGTPPAPATGAGRWADGQPLPFVHTRNFSLNTSAVDSVASVLNDPLWYAAKWGGFKDSNDNDIPDEVPEWDADVSGPGAGTPDNYFLVTNALKLSEQLREAFEAILGDAAAASSASVNSGSISTETRIYQATFDTGNWTGDLAAYGVNPTTGALIDTPIWNAKDELPAPAARSIITVNSNNTAVPFRWTNLDTVRRDQLSTVQTTQQNYVEYLRGVATLEGNSALNLRARGDSKIGDIVNSAPVFVAAPRARYSDSMPDTTPYSDFILEQRNRNPMIYVGANDGMLHGFDAGGLLPDGADADTLPEGEDPDGGIEVFAFIPKSVFPNLRELPRQTYAHRYFVDGSPNTNDVFFGGNWHTVLAGGLNLGGQAIYALDITDPSQLAGAEGSPNGIYLWEFNDQSPEGRDLGYTFSQPAIVRLQNGRWAAVFGNGYNNTVDDTATGGVPSLTGNAVLYIVDIATGALIKKFDTLVGMSDPRAASRPNGLATPTMVDVDGDRIVDHAYAGDLLGNMWKFDLRSANDAEWGFAFGTTDAPQPLFSATDAAGNIQPITERPEVARGPFGAGVMVLFGTGKFLEDTDKIVNVNLPKEQAFYGLVDRNTYTASDRIVRDDLVEQTITSERTVPASGDLVERQIRTTSQNGPNGNGFYLTLVSPNGYDGERQVTDPLVRGDRVIFTTLIPNNQSCGAGGSSWLMVLDLLSGSRLTDAQLDTNGDGQVDSSDESASGIGRSDEIMARPASLLCLTGDCEADRLLSSGSSGELVEEALRSIGAVQGRQSWRQIR